MMCSIFLILTSEKNMIKASQRVRTESRHFSAETDPEAIISIDRDVDNPNDSTLLFGLSLIHI